MQKLIRVSLSLLVVVTGLLAVTLSIGMAESVLRVFDPKGLALAAVGMSAIGTILVILGGHLVKVELKPAKITP